MATILSPSTWTQALSLRLKRILGTQQPSSSGPDRAPTPKNPTEGAADHDDEWGDWVIPTPECEKQVKYLPPYLEEPREDEDDLLNIAFQEFIARQRVMARDAQREVENKGGKPIDGEKEDGLFYLEEIPPGIRNPYNTPDDSGPIQNLEHFLVDLDACGW
ncbi:hypothetical protein N0V84_000975 [Fusarium piperis]|uniref:Uncharacterized protein n=1 Tax=Fusarium piperis TaxID=1435070 RepID=A0A9W8WM81_9HYPO|nr:hypothetical protein N0V84_000975 [Fusarium piperis]